MTDPQTQCSWTIAPYFLVDDVVEAARMPVFASGGIAGVNDLVVIAAGSPPGQAGSTNTVKVHRIGDLADSGGLLQGQQRPARERVGVWPARSPL